MPSVNFNLTRMSGGETPVPSPVRGGEKEAKNGVRSTTTLHFSLNHLISGRRKGEIMLKFLTLRDIGDTKDLMGVFLNSKHND